jgi:hypothetical protein
MNAKEALRMAGVAIDGLAMLDDLIGLGKPVEATLEAIKAALKAIRGGVDGDLSPQAVLIQLESLHEQLAANDAAADAGLSKRFPT